MERAEIELEALRKAATELGTVSCYNEAEANRLSHLVSQMQVGSHTHERDRISIVKTD